jgi:branched-chain amino acid transport system permease protein
MVGFQRRPFEIAALAAIVVAIVLVPIFGSRLIVYNMTIVAIYATVVMALNLLLGLAGQVSFAQTSFMAIGGYGSAIMTTRLGLDPWLALAAAALLAAVAAIVIGRPLLRLRGHYLSMATFALALGTYSFATAATWLTNGGIGISGVPPFAIGPLSFEEPHAFYVLSWAIAAITLIIVMLLANSFIGRAWRALATGQHVAASLGVDTTHYKLVAFVIAAAIASVAGSTYVEFTSFAGPDLYDVNIILTIFIMLYVGGRGSTVGPIVGAAVLTLVPQLISGLERYQNLVFFVLLLALILAAPNGLFGATPQANIAAPGWLRSRLCRLAGHRQRP